MTNQNFTIVHWTIPSWANEIIKDTLNNTECSSLMDVLFVSFRISTMWQQARSENLRIVYHGESGTYEMSEGDFLEKERKLCADSHVDISISIPEELMALLISESEESEPSEDCVAGEDLQEEENEPTDQDPDDSELAVQLTLDRDEALKVAIYFTPENHAALCRLMIEAEISSVEQMLNRCIFRLGEVMLAQLEGANLGALRGSTIEAWEVPFLPNVLDSVSTEQGSALQIE